MLTRQAVLVNGNALLLVNHQIHDETQELIHGLTKSGLLRYKLDCMLVDGSPIYPTWLSIPVLSTSVSGVEVELRFVGEFHQLMSTEWMLNSMATVVRMFTLLHRFLENGLSFIDREGEDYTVKVDEVVLNIVSPSSIARGSFRSTGPRHPNEPARRNPLRNPLRFAAIFESKTFPIDFLLRRFLDSYHHLSVSLFSKSTLERVRFIEILLDGELKKIWNSEAIRANIARRQR